MNIVRVKGIGDRALIKRTPALLWINRKTPKEIRSIKKIGEEDIGEKFEEI